MKKHLLIFILLISVLFIRTNNVNGESYSNDNNNGNLGKPVDGTGCTSRTKTAWCGNEMQGFQVRIYTEDPEDKKPDQFVSGPYYFYFFDGDTSTSGFPAYFCSLKDAYKDKGTHIEYNYEYLGLATDRYQCCQYDIKNNIKYIDINGSKADERIWGMFYSNADKFNSYLTNNGEYTVFKQILNMINYNVRNDVTYNDYAIIEPLVTVRFNQKYYTGTINALMATNQGFRNNSISGGWNFINIYSLIGQTFVVKGSGTCVGSETRKPAGFTIKNIDYGSKNKSTYSGCGYNKFYIKDAFVNDTCDASANTKSPAARIQVYEKKYPDDNKLLNFELDANKACSSSKNSDISASCLRAELATGAAFNEKDLSNYNFKVSMPSGNKNAYCLATYTLTPSINTPNFGDVKAGMAFIGGTANPEVIATGRLNLVCYLYNVANGDENVDVFQNLDYDNFVNSASFAGQNLVSGNTTSTRTAHTSDTYNNEKYIKYEKTITRTYLTAGVNVEIGSGRIVDEPSNSTRVLYGYYSKLGEKKGKHSVNFGITLNNGTIVNTEKLSYSNADACYYNISNELIDYKFRTIDTSNPFIGKNGRNNKGKGRTVGANWCYEVNGTFDCSSDNALVQSVIINTNNSYNKLNQKPKYKFVLTPSTINKIREYNSTHDVYDLDKYELVCDVNTNKCKSGFFRTISDSITEGKTLLVP